MSQSNNGHNISDSTLAADRRTQTGPRLPSRTLTRVNGVLPPPS
jgi:hypothetical protein